MSSTTSWKTAIKRSKPSAPLSYLLSEGLLSGDLLDYGCGRGDDLRFLQRNNYAADGYDPHWGPLKLRSKVYDTILCTYVLNVLPEKEMRAVIKDIGSRLTPGGTAFLTVRRDVATDGETSRGLQRDVRLDLPIVKSKSGQFCIYKLS